MGNSPQIPYWDGATASLPMLHLLGSPMLRTSRASGVGTANLPYLEIKLTFECTA